MRDTKEPALLSLVRELVDSLGQLVAGHLRLARAEIGGDARRFARRTALVSLAAAFGLVGYGLACVAAALALARAVGAPLAFLTLGGAHVLGASIALGILLGRAPAGPLDGSLAAVDRTLRSLAALGPDASAPPRSPHGAPDETLAPAVEAAVP
jgi:hypothetical protein